MLVVVVLASLVYRSLSAGGRQVCIEHSVYNQRLWTTFHLGGAARHSLKSCDQSQLQDLKKQVIYRVYWHLFCGKEGSISEHEAKYYCTIIPKHKCNTAT